MEGTSSCSNPRVALLLWSRDGIFYKLEFMVKGHLVVKFARILKFLPTSQKINEFWECCLNMPHVIQSVFHTIPKLEKCLPHQHRWPMRLQEGSRLDVQNNFCVARGETKHPHLWQHIFWQLAKRSNENEYLEEDDLHKRPTGDGLGERESWRRNFVLFCCALLSFRFKTSARGGG